MIKSTLIFNALFLTFCSQACAQFPNRNDLESEMLKGKVKSMKECSYMAEKTADKIRKSSDQATLLRNVLFNEKGYVTESTNYGESVIDLVTTTYIRRENGDVLLLCPRDGGKKTDSMLIQYQRDTAGRIIHSTVADYARKKSNEVCYVYNAQGQLVEMNMPGLSHETFGYDQSRTFNHHNSLCNGQ